MNPYIALAAVVFWVASVGGAYFKGQSTGADREIAAQARINKAIDQTREAAQQGAADAIAKLKPVNTTIRSRTETIVRENPVYRDCVADAGGMRNINSALTGKLAEPSAGEQLPKADGAK